MAKRIISLLLLWLLAAISRSSLDAQDVQAPANVMDMSLEELLKVEIDSVFGASGYKQKIVDAPASITVITADEIKRYGYRTLADILRNVPGFYVTTDRVYGYVGERGFGPPGDFNSRFLLLVDGHRMNDRVDGGVAIGMDFPIDVDLFERVEVIRGPNSSTYIASALLGVINVVTKRAGNAKELVVSSSAASYGTYQSRLSYSQRLDNGLAMLLSGTFYNSHGPNQLYFKEFDTPATNNGIAQNADGGRANQFFAKLTYGYFTLECAYGSSQQHDPTASYGTIFDDPRERIDLSSAYVDLSYDHRFGSDWGYQARLYYDDGHYFGVYPEPGGDATEVLNQDLSSGQDAGASFALSKKVPLGQTVVAGMEYRDNFQQDQRNYDDQPYLLYLDSRQSSSLWGVYIQDEIPIRKGLILDFGLSYDRYSTFGGTTNPRAALIYHPLEPTTLKLLYGQSFRAPNAFETYYAITGSQEANPLLKPETAKTTELVWEQSLRKNFHLVVSGYYYPIRGVIDAVTDPASGAIVYQNSGRINLKGAEITLKRQSRYGLEAGLSLSLQNAKNLDSPAPLTNSPHLLGQASFSVPLFNKKLFASMDLQYVSQRSTLGGNFAGAYFLPNFTLFSQKALKGWEVSASVYDAINEKYGDPASVAHAQDIIFQDGRNFRIKLTYHFF